MCRAVHGADAAVTYGRFIDFMFDDSTFIVELKF